MTLLLLSGAVLSGCAKEEHEQLQGSLFFAAGKYLAALDLSDGSTSVVANMGDVEVLAVTPSLESRLLLNVIGQQNRQSVQQLVLYDVATKQRKPVMRARVGSYLPGTRYLAFDDGARLWMGEPKPGYWAKTEVVQHRYNANVDVMPISDSRFIYRVGDDAFFVYDRVADRSIALEGLEAMCSLDRALWVFEREQMLCRAEVGDGVYEYAFVGLDGSKVETLPLPGDQDLRPIAYLHDQGVLILTERWQTAISKRWSWGVWVYRLDSGEFYRLLDNQHLGDTVVYSSRYHG